MTFSEFDSSFSIGSSKKHNLLVGREDDRETLIITSHTAVVFKVLEQPTVLSNPKGGSNVAGSDFIAPFCVIA